MKVVSSPSSVASGKYGFEKLIVWQKAMAFCESVYKTTKDFPKEELFGLTSQLRRASSSIPLNIAEGSASKSKKEFNFFLSIALRSQYECITILKLCFRLNLLSECDYLELFKKCDEVGRLLHALIKSQKIRQHPARTNQQGQNAASKVGPITDNRKLTTDN
jgi:four helix bundle protein